MLNAYDVLRRNPSFVKMAGTGFLFETVADFDDKAEVRGALRGKGLFEHGQPPPALAREEDVDYYLKDFLKAKDFSVQHADKTDRAVAKLKAWLKATGKQATIGNVTAEVAADYLETVPGTRKTRVNITGLLSSYFTYVAKTRKKLDANPFEGLAGELEGNAKVIKKRPYTDDEIAKLLAPARPDLKPKEKIKHAAMLDTIRVLALSGMRASELVSLTKSDCRGGLFRVHGGPDDEDRKGKTKAAKREIPIHSELAAMVEARRGKVGKTDLLFPEWLVRPRGKPVPGRPAEGSAHALGKLFAEHRIACGVDDQKKGERQSRIDLHSLRRYFAAKAMEAIAKGEAGFTPWTLADVMGHDRETLPLPMTGKYANLSPIEERRKCVESVKLPSVAVKLPAAEKATGEAKEA
ncbi:tyrosine-type recombinase/integrase [Aestuariivirga sp.]|uniref:tyrosine-type recombinase/integrase n=1 Tax=Aestuariivirga sp. TaxID=2650926 RepID=UPI0035943F62